MTHLPTEQITFPGIFVNLLIDTVAHWDISPDELLAGSSINRLRLQDPFWQINYQTLTMLLLRAVELTGEPGIAFYIGMQVKISSYGLLGFTIMVAKNLREVIELTQQFVPLQVTGAKIRLEFIDNRAVISIETDWLDRQVWIDRMTYEFVAAGLLLSVPSVMETISGEPLSINFDLECEMPEFFQRFEHFFKGKVHYSQPYARVSFDVSYLDMPCLMADPLLQTVMRETVKKS